MSSLWNLIHGPTLKGSLFVDGEFVSHAGKLLRFKIDCDALTDGDIETIAARVADKIYYSNVVYIPEGGRRLGQALRRYKSGREEGLENCLLIVDDVWTTGKSMQEWREHYSQKYLNIEGLVLFARGRYPDWVTPVFDLNPIFW